MPAVSGKQLKAMYAAAAGHSTLGIPQKVGAEYVKATPPKVKKNLLAHKAAAKGFRRRSKEGYS